MTPVYVVVPILFAAFAIVGLISLAGISVVGLVRHGDLWIASRHRRRQGFADALGLERRGSSMSGQLEGHRVAVEEIPTDQAGFARVRVRVWTSVQLQGTLTFEPALPVHSLLDVVGRPRVELGDGGLGGRVRVDGVSETARTVLLDDAVRGQLIGWRRDGPSFDGTALRGSVGGVVGAEVASYLLELCALASAMDAAALRPWSEAADEFGLTLSVDGCQLLGRVDGRELLARVYRVEDGLRTEVAVQLRGSLARGTCISREGVASIRLGDPVLDGGVSSGGR